MTSCFVPSNTITLFTHCLAWYANNTDNRFVGAWCCHEALSKGFKVTGTVRSPAKGDALCSLFPGQPINYEIVANLTDPHGFDEVIRKYKVCTYY